MQLQIEALTYKLHTGDLGIPPNLEDMSPSSEPIYNSEGKRLDTHDFCIRKKLKEELNNLTTKMASLNPDFKPLAHYKLPATCVCNTVMIPQNEYPEISFVWFLSGPRRNNLKNTEKECSAKILTGGKGSVKEGKIRIKDSQMLPGGYESLHTLMIANTMENVKISVEKKHTEARYRYP